MNKRIRMSRVSEIPSKVKMIDLTKEAQDPAVTKMIAKVDRNFQKMISESNIPSFLQMKKVLSIGAFMLNAKLIYRIVGDANFRILMGYYRDSITNYIFDNVCESNSDIFKKTMGIDITDMARRYAWISVSTGYETKYTTDADQPRTLSSIRVWVESKPRVTQVEDGQETLYVKMPFSEYNPNRLSQVILSAIKVVNDYLVYSYLVNRPTAAIGSPDMPAKRRMAVELADAVRPGVMSVLNRYAIDDVHTGATDEFVRDFINTVDPAILKYIAALTANAGISSEVIAEALNRCSIHAHYTVNEEGFEKSTNLCVVEIPGVTDANGNEIKVSYEYTFEDIIDLSFEVGREAIRSASISKTRLDKIGSTIRTYMMNMVDLCIAMVLNDHNAES